MKTHDLTNRLRTLYNIDRHQVPELTDAEWPKFRDDPPRFLARCPDTLADAIMREVEKRQRPAINDHLGRSDKDFAIEFGEYLAVAADRLLAEFRRETLDGDGVDSDIFQGLESAAYEFRKRAARVVPAVPDPGRGFEEGMG
jgi:hypothetical protein